MNDRDPFERALELLRDSQGAELPVPALEARLRARAAVPRRRLLRRVALLLAAVLLAGTALSASGAVSWLRRWWYEVEIDGVRSTGVVDEGGDRILFQTARGETGSIGIRRERLEGGRLRTRIDFHREGPRRVEHDVAESVEGDAPLEFLPASALDGATPLHVGAAIEIYAIPGTEGGTRLVARQALPDGPRLVEIARLPFDLWRDGATASVTERPDGGFDLAFESGNGAALELAWRPVEGDPGARHGPTTLETPDGRVKVRVESDPQPR
jgi:hypothetical protein